MNKRNKQPQSVDGFITRREPMSARPEIRDQNITGNKQMSDQEITSVRPDASEPGLLQFGDEPATEVNLPEVSKKSKWAKFADKRSKQKLTRRQKRKRVLLVCGVLILIFGGWFGYKAFKNFSRLFGGGSIFSVFDSTRLKGEDVGRVNILLAGNSADDPGHAGANLTDSIMIVSLDTVHHTAVMISIPRDLWVDYQTQDCSVGYQGKINAAYECGEQTKFNQPGYAKGGMGLLEKIVHDNLGVNINYYALINYAAFKDAVDAVGTIKINLQTGDPRGIYDPTFDWQCHNTCSMVKYPNGWVTLNGQQALDLARVRGDFGGYGAGNDFGRAERQRQMMVALKDKIMSAGTFSNPVALTKLMDAIGKNVKTDMKPNEVHRAYNLGKEVDSKNIKSAGLTMDNYLTSYNVAGQSALAPKAGLNSYSDIQSYFKRLLSSDPVAQEDAHVVVLNGSNRAGLAGTQSEKLGNVFTVDEVANAIKGTNKTIIYDLSGNKPASKQRLADEYHVTVKSKAETPAPYNTYDTDFVIILGNDVITQ